MASLPPAGREKTGKAGCTWPAIGHGASLRQRSAGHGETERAVSINDVHTDVVHLWL